MWARASRRERVPYRLGDERLVVATRSLLRGETCRVADVRARACGDEALRHARALRDAHVAVDRAQVQRRITVELGRVDRAARGEERNERRVCSEDVRRR